MSTNSITTSSTGDAAPTTSPPDSPSTAGKRFLRRAKRWAALQQKKQQLQQQSGSSTPPPAALDHASKIGTPLISYRNVLPSSATTGSSQSLVATRPPVPLPPPIVLCHGGEYCRVVSYQKRCRGSSGPSCIISLFFVSAHDLLSPTGSNCSTCPPPTIISGTLLWDCRRTTSP